MSSDICERAAITINLSIRKMRERPVKPKGSHERPLTYFLMALMYSLTACALQSSEV